MSDVRNGDADDPRNKPNEQVGSNEKAIARADDVEIASPEHDVRLDGEELKGQALVSATQAIALHQEEYEGILPHPKQFNEYNPNAQEVLLEIAREQVKAAFTDESARQDALVEAEIKQSARGQMLSSIIIILALAAAIVVTICTSNATVAMLIVGIPLVAIIGNLFKPVKSKGITPKDIKIKE